MDLNFKLGKSEALIQLLGKGSSIAKRHLCVECGNLVSCYKHKGEPVKLRIVNLYRHLGTQTEIAGRMSQEVAYRIACMRTETRQLRSKVLSNEGIDRKKRVIIAQSHVFSKGLFQSATWPNLRDADRL